MRALLLVAIAISSLNSVFLSAQDARPEPGLSAEIPSADRAKFKDVRDAKDWRNPMVTIFAHEVHIRSRSLTGDGIRVPVEQLRQQLVKLPVGDWPYGRVVQAQDNGLVSSEDRDSMKRTHDAAVEVLKALKIEADWWPSA
jgi:hypothetical protein